MVSFTTRLRLLLCLLVLQSSWYVVLSTVQLLDRWCLPVVLQLTSVLACVTLAGLVPEEWMCGLNLLLFCSFLFLVTVDVSFRTWVVLWSVLSIVLKKVWVLVQACGLGLDISGSGAIGRM